MSSCGRGRPHSAAPKAIAKGTRKWFNDGDESGEAENQEERVPRSDDNHKTWRITLFAVMRRSTNIRAIAIVAILGCLAFAGHWLWTTPLAPIPSKAAVGRLNLEQRGAELMVRFVPRESLSSITLLLPKPIPGSQEFCAHPDFPLSVRVRVTAAGGTNVIDDLITRERMQWTSWNNGPSLLLMLDGWLSQHLDGERVYDLGILVESAISYLGEAGVFLHWMDRGYVWGRERQELRLSSSLRE